MTDLKTLLASLETRFTAIKAGVESHLKQVRDEIEATPKMLEAKVAEGESQLEEIVALLGVVKAIKEGEDLFKRVEASLAGVPADVEAVVKKVESIL